MTSPTILLIDNGSRRPESARNLRRLAARLGGDLGRTVHPVSLQHAHKIPVEDLDGLPADTFHPFMAQRLAAGDRRFILLPLFFGPSRALSAFIPQQQGKLADEYGEFELRLCPVLCPLPAGEPRLARILCHQLPPLERTGRQRVILVDHGSPLPDVTAVRRYLAAEMRRMLGPEVELLEAVMERRAGAEYDFNGQLLEEVLQQAGEEDDSDPVAVSQLFLSPGRHAGSGGDIETICGRVAEAHPGWRILTSGLIGEHEGLIDILRDRLESAL